MQNKYYTVHRYKMALGIKYKNSNLYKSHSKSHSRTLCKNLYFHICIFNKVQNLSFSLVVYTHCTQVFIRLFFGSVLLQQ